MLDLAHIITLLPAFTLVLLRVSGIMLIAPVFSSSTFPARFRVGLAVFISLIVFPMVQPTMTEVPLSIFAIGLAAGGELLIGLIIGMSVSLLFAGIELAAQLISQQMGLGLARLIDPALEEETGVLEQFYVLIATALLLICNGHLLIIRGVLDSFAVLPPMTFSLQPEVLHILRGLLATSFVLALKMSVPLMVVMFLVSMMMGFLGRTVPQINILVVGFPLRIAVGLLAMVGSFGVTLVVFSEGYSRTVDAVGQMIRHLGA